MSNIIIIVVIVLVFSFIMAMIITGNDKHISEEDREKMVDAPSVLLDEESNSNTNNNVINEDLSDNFLVLNEFKPDKININNDIEKENDMVNNSDIVNSDTNIIKKGVEDNNDVKDKFLDIDDEVI